MDMERSTQSGVILCRLDAAQYRGLWSRTLRRLATMFPGRATADVEDAVADAVMRVLEGGQTWEDAEVTDARILLLARWSLLNRMRTESEHMRLADGIDSPPPLRLIRNIAFLRMKYG
jgi:hypothetical protein